MNELLSTAQAASYLNVKPKTLATHWFKWGIPVYRVGRNNRYRVSDLDKWLEDRKLTQPERVNV